MSNLTGNEAKPSALFANNSVLVVEDDPIAVKIAQFILHDYFDVTVCVAKCGEQAIDLCDQQSFDLIIMDVGLPDIDGVRVAEHIKRESRLNQETPIVGLTAHAHYKPQQPALMSMYEKPLTYDMCHDIAAILMRGQTAPSQR